MAKYYTVMTSEEMIDIFFSRFPQLSLIKGNGYYEEYVACNELAFSLGIDKSFHDWCWCNAEFYEDDGDYAYIPPILYMDLLDKHKHKMRVFSS